MKKQNTMRTKIEKAKNRLEKAREKLKNLKNKRKKQAEQKEIIELIEEIKEQNGTGRRIYSSDNLRVDLKEHTNYGQIRPHSREYRVRYKNPENKDRYAWEWVFEYEETDIDSFRGPNTEIKKYKKNWKNWEKMLEQAAIETVEEEIRSVKEEMKEKFNGDVN